MTSVVDKQNTQNYSKIHKIWLNFEWYVRLGSEDKETTCSVPILSSFVFVKGAAVIG